MEIDNKQDTVTITLTRAEANKLRFELLMLDTARNKLTLRQELIDGIEQPPSGPVAAVTRSRASEAIMEVVDDLLCRADNWPPGGRRRAAIIDDADDLRHIARQVRLGFIQEATNATAMLDTVVRERIPECAYPFVGLRTPPRRGTLKSSTPDMREVNAGPGKWSREE